MPVTSLGAWAANNTFPASPALGCIPKLLPFVHPAGVFFKAASSLSQQVPGEGLFGADCVCVPECIHYSVKFCLVSILKKNSEKAADIAGCNF